MANRTDELVKMMQAHVAPQQMAQARRPGIQRRIELVQGTTEAESSRGIQGSPQGGDTTTTFNPISTSTAPPVTSAVPNETAMLWLTDAAAGSPSIYYLLARSPYPTPFERIPHEMWLNLPEHPLPPFGGPIGANLRAPDALQSIPTEAQLFMGNASSFGETVATTMPTDSYDIAIDMTPENWSSDNGVL